MEGHHQERAPSPHHRRGVPQALHRHYARRVCSGLVFGSPTPAVTGVAHVVSPVWSTPVVGAPCRRASTARHQGSGWTQPKTHHRSHSRGWVTLPAVHHTRGTPQEEEPSRPHTRGARPAEADRRRLTDHQEGTTTQGHPKRDPTPEGPHTGTPPNRATALADQHDQGTPPQGRDHHSKLPLEPGHSRVKSPTIGMR